MNGEKVEVGMALKKTPKKVKLVEVDTEKNALLQALRNRIYVHDNGRHNDPERATVLTVIRALVFLVERSK